MHSTFPDQDDVFWLCLTVGNRARKPLDHLLNWLQKPTEHKELVACGEKVAQLQSHKADQLMKGFEMTTTQFDWCGLIENQPTGLRALAHELALDLLLNGAGNFHRRFQRPLQRQLITFNSGCLVDLEAFVCSVQSMTRGIGV